MLQHSVEGSRWRRSTRSEIKASHVGDSTQENNPKLYAFPTNSYFKPPSSHPAVSHGFQTSLLRGEAGISQSSRLSSKFDREMHHPSSSGRSFPRQLSPHREIEKVPVIRRQLRISSVALFVHSRFPRGVAPLSCGAHPGLVPSWHRHLDGIHAVVRELELSWDSLSSCRAVGLQKRGPRTGSLASLACCLSS